MMEVVCAREVHCVLKGHNGDVNCTAWSPTSKDTLCSCSGDKKIRVWEIGASGSGDAKQDPTHTIVAHKYYVTSCAYNPSGDLLASTSSDNTIKLWSTASWTSLGELSLHGEGVRSCCFSPDGNLLASASDDATVRVWEVGALRCIATIDRHREGVTCCRFAPNGWLLATGARNGQFIFFDVYTGNSATKKRIITVHNGSINAIALQPLKQTTTLPGEATPTSEGGSVTSVPSCDDGDVYICREQEYFFATAGDDCIVKIWRVRCDDSDENLGSRSVLVTMAAELTRHTGPVYSCDYHPRLPYLATGSGDKTIIIWNVESYESIQQIEAHSRYVTYVCFAPSGSFLATASNDCTVKIWTVKSVVENLDEQGGSSSTDRVVTSKQPSFISTATWSVDGVCQWVESVSKQQNAPGSSVHPDDMRAADRLAGALEQLSLCRERRGERDGAGDEDYIICPITCQVMRDPVVATDGFSYERSAIIGWFSKGRRTSPVTNLPLSSTLLLPNQALKMAAEKRNS